MSFLARSVRVAARRSVTRSRCYTTELESISPKQEWLVEQQAKQHHAEETTHLWRKISWYVCMPAIITCTAWVYNAEAEHNAHLEHLRAENDGHLPEVPAYDYLNKRAKPFPWGMNSLFFNSHSQKNMEESA